MGNTGEIIKRRTTVGELRHQLRNVLSDVPIEVIENRGNENVYAIHDADYNVVYLFIHPEKAK